MISNSIETELESLRIQLNKANYDLSNSRTEAERTKLRFEDMLRDRDTQIIIEQKKADDLQKDRKFLFEKQQSQATELLTLQDEYANYKVSPRPWYLLSLHPMPLVASHLIIHSQNAIPQPPCLSRPA